MELKYLFVLLCIELSLAHRYYNYHSHSDSYSDEDDYSEETPEPPKPRKHPVQVTKIYLKENPKAIVKTDVGDKNLKKVVSQYEVTENVIDIPNDNTINGRVDPKFMLDKPLNRVDNKKSNKETVNNENKGKIDPEKEIKRLENEYRSIVRMLENNKNQDTHSKMINFREISNKLANFWNDVKETFAKMAGDIENGARTVSNEIDKAHSFLNKLHASGRNVVTKVGSFFGRK